MNSDPRIDEYINSARTFAKPIIEYLRNLMHKACPEIQETIKWSFPHFTLDNKIVCHISAFKNHSSFGFWNVDKMDYPDEMLQKIGVTPMRSLGKIQRQENLPEEKVIVSYIHNAIEALNKPKTKPLPNDTKPKILDTPLDLVEALDENEKAKKTFDSFSYSNKKEYVEWITEAKTESTRLKRLETTMEWLADGKVRSWKYIN